MELDSIVANMLNHNRLSVHLELRVHLGQNCSSCREADEIVVLPLVECQVGIERTLEVHKVFSVECDIRQEGIGRLVLHINLDLIVRLGSTILSHHVERVDILLFGSNFLLRHRDILEAVCRGVVHINITGLEGDRIEVTSSLEMVKHSAVDGNTTEVHTMARFRHHREGIVTGIATVLTGNREGALLTEFGRLYIHFLSFLSSDVSHRRHNGLCRFDSRRRQNDGIFVLRRVESINHHAIKHDTSQKRIVALRFPNAHFIRLLRSLRVSRSHLDSIFCTALNRCLRGNERLLCLGRDGIKPNGGVRRYSIFRFVCAVFREVSATNLNVCQVSIGRRRSWEDPFVGVFNRTVHLPFQTIGRLNEYYRIPVVFTLEDNDLIGAFLLQFEIRATQTGNIVAIDFKGVDLAGSRNGRVKTRNGAGALGLTVSSSNGNSSSRSGICQSDGLSGILLLELNYRHLLRRNGIFVFTRSLERNRMTIVVHSREAGQIGTVGLGLAEGIDGGLGVAILGKNSNSERIVQAAF